jgi:CRP-like cAMP-binding protein
MLVDRHRSLGLLLVRSLLEQLRAASARMVDRTTLSAPGRVHAELLRLARLGDGTVIRPAPVHAALAVRVQSTRETVSRAVSALERRGIVRREGDALIIVAAGRLEELVV